MNIQVGDVCEAFEEWTPSAFAFDWDRAGLHTGDPHWPVSSVLVCLTVTRDALARALKLKANLIVTHHPLLWEPLKNLRADNESAQLPLELAAEKIACFSTHTSLDVAPGGVNDCLAGALKLQARRPLFPVSHVRQTKLVTFVPQTHARTLLNALSAAGAGVIGEYTHCSFSTPGTGTFLPGAAANPYSGGKGIINEEPELRFEMLTASHCITAVISALRAAHPYEEPAIDIIPLDTPLPALGLGIRGELPKPLSLDAFAAQVRQALGLSHVRIVGPSRKMVRTVGVMGGSGGGEVRNVPGDVDVFVTGDLRYHDALDAGQRDLCLIDAGHAGTERLVVPALSRFLKGRFPGLGIACLREPETFRLA